MVLILFMGSIIYENFKPFKGKIVKLEDSFNLWAKNLNFDKGIVTINDSIILYGSTFPFNDSANTSNIKFNKGFCIYNISQPYRIIKKSKSDTLFIIQSSDTSYFKFIDPDKIDDNDLTFKQLFDKIFKK